MPPAEAPIPTVRNDVPLLFGASAVKELLIILDLMARIHSVPL
jgi:hypothetical protein